jgi:hypothetical protein
VYKPPYTVGQRQKSLLPSNPGDKPTSGYSKSNVVDCEVIPRPGKGNQSNKIPVAKLVDHRDVRMKEKPWDRKKDLVTTEANTLSTCSDRENPAFQKELEETKMVDFWIFPEECDDQFFDKRTRLVYRNIMSVTINGRHYPLFAGNNRAPEFVYEAVENAREMRNEFRRKLAPSSKLKSVILSHSASHSSRSGTSIMTNQEIFKSNVLGRPNVYDGALVSQANDMVRRARKEALAKQKEQGNAKK